MSALGHYWHSLLLLFWSRASSTYCYEHENLKKHITILDGEAFQVCMLMNTISPVVTVQCWS